MDTETLLPIVLFLWIFPFLFIFYVFLKIARRRYKPDPEMKAVADLNGWLYSPDGKHDINYPGSYKRGRKFQLLSGTLDNEICFSQFTQTEHRGSKNQQTYSRLITVIDIPDTESNFIFSNHLISPSASGGNLQNIGKSQAVTLEGDFGKAFRVAAPHADRNQALVILSPNAMSYILKNFIDADFEILNDKLMIYEYGEEKFTVAHRIDILQKIPELLNVTRLDTDDVKNSLTAMNRSYVAESSGLSRTAAGDGIDERLAVSRSKLAMKGIFIFILFAMFAILNVYGARFLKSSSFLPFFILQLSFVGWDYFRRRKRNQLKKQIAQNIMNDDANNRRA